MNERKETGFSTRSTTPAPGGFSPRRPRRPGPRDSGEQEQALEALSRTILDLAERYGVELDESLSEAGGLLYDSRALTSTEALDILSVRGLPQPPDPDRWKRGLDLLGSDEDRTSLAWLVRQQHLLIQVCRLRLEASDWLSDEEIALGATPFDEK